MGNSTEGGEGGATAGQVLARGVDDGVRGVQVRAAPGKLRMERKKKCGFFRLKIFKNKI